MTQFFEAPTGMIVPSGFMVGDTSKPNFAPSSPMKVDNGYVSPEPAVSRPGDSAPPGAIATDGKVYRPGGFVPGAVITSGYVTPGGVDQPPPEPTGSYSGYVGADGNTYGFDGYATDGSGKYDPSRPLPASGWPGEGGNPPPVSPDGKGIISAPPESVKTAKDNTATLILVAIVAYLALK